MLETFQERFLIPQLEFSTVLYDLFSHSFDITTSYPYPKFTFAGDIIDIFKSFNLISDLEQLPSLSSSLLKNPANSEITDATIASFTNNPDTIPSFTDHNSEAYIRRFLDVIGDPTTFAHHLRHSVLVLNLLRSWPDSNSFDSGVTTLLNTIALTCLFHFHIICEHYNIVQCGSLDFALFIKRMTLPLNQNSSDVPSLSQYNDDEIHFLTTILPKAFKSSPMYPGEFNKGIIFPLSLGPSRFAAFTQHYTKLLASASTSPSKNNHKVPTTNIPFSIFAYLALLNTIMSSALSVAVKNKMFFLLRVFFHVPNLPPDLYRILISPNFIATSIGSNVSNLENLQVLHFTFNIFSLTCCHEMNADDKSDTISSFHLKYQQSYGFHQENQTSTFSTVLPICLASTSPITSISLKNNTKQKSPYATHLNSF